MGQYELYWYYRFDFGNVSEAAKDQFSQRYNDKVQNFSNLKSP